MSNPYNSATDRASILGPTLYFKGDLTAEEDLLIQGRVEGSMTPYAASDRRPARHGEGQHPRNSSSSRARSTAICTPKNRFSSRRPRKSAEIYSRPPSASWRAPNFSGSIDMDGKKAGQSPVKQDAAGMRMVKAAGAPPNNVLVQEIDGEALMLNSNTSGRRRARTLP